VNGALAKTKVLRLRLKDNHAKPKLQQQIERIQQLARSKQRFVIEMLDTVLAQAGR
jgi:hypothetical protein